MFVGTKNLYNFKKMFVRIFGKSIHRKSSKSVSDDVVTSTK